MLPDEGSRKRNKVRLATEALQPGMVTAEPVLNASGAVIAWQDRELDEMLIARLQGMGIGNLMVYAREVVAAGREQAVEWHAGKSPEVFRRQCEADVDRFKDMFLHISNGGALDLETTDLLVESVLDMSQDKGSIVDYTLQIRGVDAYTYEHCVSVSLISLMLGGWMRMQEEDLESLVRAAMLHDIGKGRVPLNILNKEGPLTEREYKEMKKHPELGYHVIKSEVKPDVSFAVLTHHEREDGSGYPLGFRADQLRISAKILAIADVFSAMTANRVYRKHVSPFRVFELMQNDSFGRLDPIVLDVFLKNIAHYYVDKSVLLTDGLKGKVIFMNAQDYSRPVVQTERGFVDLLGMKNLSISDVF